MGPARPNKVLQEMLNDLCDTNLSMDGILGTQTIASARKCSRISNGYPYYLHLTYKNDPKVTPVWSWAKKGLRNRIFHFID
jgi:lysozyme family protein